MLQETGLSEGCGEVFRLLTLTLLQLAHTQPCIAPAGLESIL